MVQVGAKVGLEIHQQLDTGSKLFCRCDPAAPRDYDRTITRRLRPKSGEQKITSESALFESMRNSDFVYHSGPCVCAVEEDEKPPMVPDPGSVSAVLRIAAMLGSRAHDELHVMRKTIIDGSNPAGFQRTMLAATGGSVTTGGTRVGIQSVCLEEDAGEPTGKAGEFGLGRSGIPLVEIATEPFDPGLVGDVALALGRMLRSTGSVMRGIGTIRQDVNVSVDGGTVVEVKGVQKLDLLAKVAKFEIARQRGFSEISALIPKDFVHEIHHASDILGPRSDTNGRTSRIVVLRGLGAAFRARPAGGMGLGRDLVEVSSVLHMDYLADSTVPSARISEAEVDIVSVKCNIAEQDAFLVCRGPADRIDGVVGFMINRIRRIASDGVPADTRVSLTDGATRFKRPKSGASRMYPETDVPPVLITPEQMSEAAKDIPEAYEMKEARLREAHGISPQLATKIIDHGYTDIFEKIAGTGAVFAASALCSLVTKIERDGGDRSLLTDEIIGETFGMLGAGAISKEGVEIIFSEVMRGSAASAREAASTLPAPVLDEVMITERIDGAVRMFDKLIDRRGMGALGAIMGHLMKELRGRVPGEDLNRRVREKIIARRGSH